MELTSSRVRQTERDAARSGRSGKRARSLRRVDAHRRTRNLMVTPNRAPYLALAPCFRSVTRHFSRRPRRPGAPRNPLTGPTVAESSLPVPRHLISARSPLCFSSLGRVCQPGALTALVFCPRPSLWRAREKRRAAVFFFTVPNIVTFPQLEINARRDPKYIL